MNFWLILLLFCFELTNLQLFFSYLALYAFSPLCSFIPLCLLANEVDCFCMMTLPKFQFLFLFQQIPTSSRPYSIHFKASWESMSMLTRFFFLSHSSINGMLSVFSYQGFFTLLSQGASGISRIIPRGCKTLKIPPNLSRTLQGCSSIALC